MNNSMQHVVITGAGSGSDASLASKYNEQGYHITLIGRTNEKLEYVAKSFSNPNYSIYTLDVSSFHEVEKVFKRIGEEVQPTSIVLTMAADITDYETARSGSFVSGLIGTVFSLTHSIESSLIPIIIGVIIAATSYTNAYPDALEPLTDNLFNAGMIIAVVVPVDAKAPLI